MTRHLFHLSVPTLLTALLLAASCARGTPEPGRYEGVLHITKSLRAYHSTNFLRVTTTLRVVAEISQSDSGRILTILAAVPEPPMNAFKTDNSIILGVFRPDGTCIIHGPPMGGTGDPSEYPGLVKERPRGFTLAHENIPMGVNYLIDPHLTQPITSFLYVFHKVRARTPHSGFSPVPKPQDPNAASPSPMDTGRRSHPEATSRLREQGPDEQVHTPSPVDNARRSTR